ncbi:hypothetical protein Acr_00g0065450 [Actinidia rufa]|uniref:Uncharacterized protein n=1 Tax=Actinidia rufa TaxID=165716 RepID=A0A7J0DRN2_9ERIC|nr:hypothetical protein Acr_00g0065450 [Actinidia rufa]
MGGRHVRNGAVSGDPPGTAGSGDPVAVRSSDGDQAAEHRRDEGVFSSWRSIPILIVVAIYEIDVVLLVIAKFRHKPMRSYYWRGVTEDSATEKHRVQCEEAKVRVSIATFLLGPNEAAVESLPELVDSAPPASTFLSLAKNTESSNTRNNFHSGEALALALALALVRADSVENAGA